MSRQPLEDRDYEVNAAQLRWRLAQLNAAGVPIQGYQPGGQGNVYIITVQQPAAAPPLDWSQMGTRPRRRDDGNLRRLTIALGAVIIVACIAWTVWSVLAGSGVQLPRWPWQPNGEPVVTQTEPSGWTLPNPFQPAQDAARATQDAADAVTSAVTMLVRLALVLAGLAGLWLMRGLLGPLARGAADLVRQAVRR